MYDCITSSSITSIYLGVGGGRVLSQNSNTADVGEEVGVPSQNAVTRKGRNGRIHA